MRPNPGAIAACLLAATLLGGSSWPVAAQSATGADIKAAFLLNFAKFVEWPEGGGTPDRPFSIGVLGDDMLAFALRDLSRGKSAAGRRVDARRVTPSDALADLHVLFIGASEERRLDQVLQRAQAGSVLTVSDITRFSEVGGIIQFRPERDRVRFDINLDQAERSGLTIDTRLLALARSVRRSPKPAGVLR